MPEPVCRASVVVDDTAVPGVRAIRLPAAPAAETGDLVPMGVANTGPFSFIGDWDPAAIQVPRLEPVFSTDRRRMRRLARRSGWKFGRLRDVPVRFPSGGLAYLSARGRRRIYIWPAGAPLVADPGGTA